MNRALLILLFISFAASAQKIDRKTYYNYSEDVEFRIYSLKKPRIIDRGSANYSSTIIAEKGKRFISIIFEFKNMSSKDQIIDFNNFFLKDNNSNIHKVDLVVMAMKFTARTDKMQQKLKPNTKRKIAVEFTPPFDKDEIIDELIIGNKTIRLIYN